ncbi:hypothetical protein TRICI_002504 [Trichomonascus ciferrii]|uniref:Uncharacterized protein n=1 Tax=Trichomonascus ciferrii TaxID=44093 RepID=A0A642V6V1_9ASCO|nr:hypothetical protein TRICI_002504 [Trichomonascus ciferrii]
MMFHAKFSKKFWGEAVLYAAYVYNRVPHSSTDAVPLELFEGGDLKSISGLGDLRTRIQRPIECTPQRVPSNPRFAVTFDEHYFPANMDWKFSRDADVMNSVAPYAPDTDDPFYSSCGMALPLLTSSSPAPSSSGADEPEGETSVSGGEEDSAVDETFEDAEPFVVKGPCAD